MEDVQKNIPKHQINIRRVGITDLKLPIFMLEKGDSHQHTVANISVFVDVDANSKGTHMSRLAIGIQKFVGQKLSSEIMGKIAKYIQQKCEATRAEIRYKFPYFITKIAPESMEPGTIHHDVCFTYIKEGETEKFIMSVNAIATSCCPCSKEISKHGAHNQRSRIKITCKPKNGNWVWIEDLIEVAERNSSCEIFSVLKRSDEKAVTEHAYDHPMFVEDMVRAVYNDLSQWNSLEWFDVTVKNEESIHTHDAYARMNSRD